MTKIKVVVQKGNRINKLKINLICWTDSKTQILYRHKLIPTSIYDMFRKYNHESYRIATGETELLNQLIEKHRRK